MDNSSLFDDAFWEEKMKLEHKLPKASYMGFQVDHITALCNNGDMWDKKNWQVLCDECHKNKTKKDLRENKRVKNKTKRLI